MEEMLTMSTATRLQALGTNHPRLHFTADDLPSLRQKAQGSHGRYARLLIEWVDAHTDWQPRVDYPFPNGRTTEVELEESGIFVTNAALAYVLSQEKRHLDLAKQWALRMCEVPQEEADNYGFGPYVAGLARAYDWLYAEFEPTERLRLRDHIAKIVRLLYLGSFPNHPQSQWWAECHLHHDHWIPTGGYGEAALAIAGEVGNAEIWAQRSLDEFRTAFSWLGDDGAWLEGAADWAYALAPLLWFFGAWQTVVGENLHRIPWLLHTSRYRIYHRLPDESYIYTNDSFRSGRYNTSGSASCHLLRRLASLFEDSHAQWLAAQDEEFDLKLGPKGVPQAAYEGSSMRRGWREYPHPQAFCAAWNFLWFDPSVDSTPPYDLPLAHHFENQGVVVFRSDWGEDATVASFSCGPIAGHRAAMRIESGEMRLPSNYSHGHPDFNAFTLFTQGNYFIIPPGYARRDSRFQNTVSVNGAHLLPDPQRQPHVLACMSQRGVHYVLGDASDVFPDHLGIRRYRRHMLMLQPDWFILFDELQLASTASRPWNRFEWAVHSDPQQSTLTISGTNIRWQKIGGGVELKMRILAPAEFVWERSLISSLTGEELLEALRLTAPEWYRSDMHVLSIWRCTPGELAVNALSTQGGEALAVDGQEQPWVVAFKLNKSPQADNPLLSYEYTKSHRLLLCGLPRHHTSVDVRRRGQQVEIWAGDKWDVGNDGWLVVDLE
jgi:hypothetical protein